MTDGIAAQRTPVIGLSGAGDRSRRARAAIGLLWMAVALVAMGSMSLGATGFTPGAALRALAGSIGLGPETGDVIVREIRLPRTILGLLVGASLAAAGVVLQALFRNPLADPGMIGVSSGSALGAVTVIVLGGSLPFGLHQLFGPYLLAAAAILGGLVTTIILYRIATRQGRTSVATMLLAGIAMAALLAAFTGILIFTSNDLQLREFTFWSMGSLSGATPRKLAMTAPTILVLLGMIAYLGQRLDAYVMGEAEAGHLGVDVQRLKRISIVTVSLLVGLAVAAAGPIGFIGLVVPHLLRLSIGPRHGTLIAASALLGAVLLVAADIAARLIVAPAELPIGIVTAIFGAPVFLWLLLREHALVDL